MNRWFRAVSKAAWGAVLFVGMVGLLGACFRDDSFPPPTSLVFHVLDDSVKHSLWVEWADDQLWITDTEGASRWAALDGETRADVLELFEPELRDIYAADAAMNRLPLEERPAGPACVEDEGDPVCAALELAEERVVVTFAEPEAEIINPEQFFFEAPTVLSIETAEMMLALEDLRAEVADGP